MPKIEIIFLFNKYNKLQVVRLGLSVVSYLTKISTFMPVVTQIASQGFRGAVLCRQRLLFRPQAFLSAAGFSLGRGLFTRPRALWLAAGATFIQSDVVYLNVVGTLGEVESHPGSEIGL